jgi:hypothetical protein
MNSNDLYNAIGKLDDNILEQSETTKKKSGRLTQFAMAACLGLVLFAGILMIAPQGKITLSNYSAGVTVRYSNVPFYFGDGGGNQIYLSEEELFAHYDTAVFKGTIIKIDNIMMDFNGAKEYRAIAKINVEKVYRGDCAEEEVVTVLLPCPIAFCFQSSNAGIVTKMKVGMTGIFMPVMYDETSKREENGATLMLKDVADYGFMDADRYAFLATANGLIFDRETYTSIAGATTLSEIEDYVQKMIQ